LPEISGHLFSMAARHYDGRRRRKERISMMDSGRIDLMSTLVSRNVNLQDRRTSVRLEPAMWEALDEICRREGTSINDLVGLIDRQRRESKLTAAIRVFVMAYYRAASTDEGHVGAGHGILRHAAASAESRTPKKKPSGPGRK
jgi:predicted DNA-binding ribbon-helix-helix protein